MKNAVTLAVLTLGSAANAFELYHGLQDNHVPTKLIVYQGFGGVGHGPTKPKSNRATMDHNVEWSDQYFFQTAAKSTSAPQD